MEGKQDLRGTNGTPVGSTGVPQAPLSREKVTLRTQPQHGVRDTIKAKSTFVE